MAATTSDSEGSASKESSRYQVFMVMMSETLKALMISGIEPILKEIYEKLKRDKNIHRQPTQNKLKKYKGVTLNYENIGGKLDVLDAVQFAKILLTKDEMPKDGFKSFDEIYHQHMVILSLIQCLHQTEDVTKDDKKTKKLKSMLQKEHFENRDKWSEKVYNDTVAVLEAMVAGLNPNSKSYSENKQTEFKSSIQEALTKIEHYRHKDLVLWHNPGQNANQADVKECINVLSQLKIKTVQLEKDVEHLKKSGMGKKGSNAASEGGDTPHNVSSEREAQIGMANLQINAASKGGDTTDNVSSVREAKMGIGKPTLLADEVLEKIAEQFGKDWRTIGLYLGISSATCDVFEAAKELNHCANETLKYWRAQSPTHEKPKGKLKDALIQAGRRDLAEYVEKNVGEKVEEVALLEVAKKLGGEWRAVGTYLGVEHKIMETITNVPKPSIKEAAFKMLTHWQSQLKDGENKKQVLCNALKNAKRIDIFEWVQENVNSKDN